MSRDMSDPFPFISTAVERQVVSYVPFTVRRGQSERDAGPPEHSGSSRYLDSIYD